MTNKTTHYQLILDRSGSMGSCMDSTIAGYNEQMDLIRELTNKYTDQKITVSLTMFNHETERPFAFANPIEVRNLSEANYRPNGMTALLDAVGMSVDNLKRQVGRDIEADKATVVVVIITDGYENASKEYRHKNISQMIKELEATGKWTFSYIGATLDAVEIAAKMNIRQGNSMFYDKASTRDMHNRMSHSIRSYVDYKSRGIVKEKYVLDDEEYAEEKKKRHDERHG